MNCLWFIGKCERQQLSRHLDSKACLNFWSRYDINLRLTRNRVAEKESHILYPQWGMNHHEQIRKHPVKSTAGFWDNYDLTCNYSKPEQCCLLCCTRHCGLRMKCLSVTFQYCFAVWLSILLQLEVKAHFLKWKVNKYLRVLGVDTWRFLAPVTVHPDSIFNCSAVRIDPVHAWWKKRCLKLAQLESSSTRTRVMLYKVVLTLQFVDDILKCDHWNESYWAVLSCGAVYYAVKEVLAFQSVDDILKCDHSNESYWAVLSCGAVYYAVQGGSNFCSCGWNPKVWPFIWKLLSSTFLWCCLLCCKGGSSFSVCGWYPKVRPFKWKLLSSTFLWCCLLCCTRWF